MIPHPPKHPGHPTNPDWELFDVRDSRHPRPPKGAELLLLNEGGVLIKGNYHKGVRYWAFKPGIPKDPPEEFLIPL